MSADSFDPEILQDFLTESGELLEQVESELVELESRPNDLDLLNQVFRALHTIKGSASFLAFTELVEIAHAAESALNAARNREITVTSTIMDQLLQAVDTIRTQFGEIMSGGACESAADAALVDALSRIGEGAAPDDGTSETDDRQQEDASALDLPESKLDLIDPLTADVEESIRSIRDQVDHLRDPATRAETLGHIREQHGDLSRTIEFFEIPESLSLVTDLGTALDAAGSIDDGGATQLVPRIVALCELIERQNHAMRERRLLTWDTSTLMERVARILDGDLPEDGALDEDAGAEHALRFDGVITDDDAPAQTPAETPDAGNTPDAASTETPRAATQGVGQIEQSIRVDVDRLEELMNLVGELVLQKNRVLGLSEEFDRGTAVTNAATLQEQFETTAGVLDRITGDIQMAVMRTRMQPLNKLLGKYPRLIRDLASKTDKEIELVIEGGETEVDKTVIEELGDPLVHLLRNSADHGIEPPHEREAAGKSRKGTITIRAGHAGSHVSVRVIDDGRGLDRETIGAKAVEKGVINEDQLEHMTDEEVHRLILAAGFSTADRSPISRDAASGWMSSGRTSSPISTAS